MKKCISRHTKTWTYLFEIEYDPVTVTITPAFNNNAVAVGDADSLSMSGPSVLFSSYNIRSYLKSDISFRQNCKIKGYFVFDIEDHHGMSIGRLIFEI